MLYINPSTYNLSPLILDFKPLSAALHIAFDTRPQRSTNFCSQGYQRIHSVMSTPLSYAQVCAKENGGEVSLRASIAMGK